MIEIGEFVKNFASAFEETDESMFSTNTRYREELDEWDSLTALSVIAMVDSEYKVVIGGEDIRDSATIEDLYQIVKSRK